MPPALKSSHVTCCPTTILDPCQPDVLFDRLTCRLQSVLVPRAPGLIWPQHQRAGAGAFACRAVQPDHGELHQGQIAEIANELVNRLRRNLEG